MIYTYSTGPSRPPGLIGRVVGVIISMLALAGAAFFGVFIFLFVLGVILIGGTAIALRMWWFKRQLMAAARRHQTAPPGHRPSDRPRDYIDAEFTEH